MDTPKREKIRYASKSREAVSAHWFERHPVDPRAKVMKWPQPSRPNVKRSVILIRFRKFIEGEQLSAHDIAFFLGSYQSWWLLTPDLAEREHAKRVLSRLMYLIDLHDTQEALS